MNKQLYEALIEKEEQIAELKAEIMMLRANNMSDAIVYAQNLIEELTEEQLEERFKWLSEVVEHLDVHLSYHREYEDDEE